MTKIVITSVLALILGSLIGWFQHALTYTNLKERFYVPATAASNVASTATASAEAIIKDGSDPASAVVKDGAPRLEIKGGTTFDFGSMTQGATKDHAFFVRNIGNAPMNLEVAGSSCKCTIGTLDKSSLMPGEETAINLKWTATGVLDEFSQNATIKTNDPEHTSVLLTVRGIVARTIHFDPSELILGEFSATDKLEKKIMMFSYASTPLSVDSGVWADPKTVDRVLPQAKMVPLDTTKYPRHNAATSVAEITVSIRPGMPIGPINSKLQIQTNNENLTNLEMSVSGKVGGDLHLIGGPSFNTDTNILNIGKVSRLTGTTVKVHLDVRGADRESIVPKVESVIPAESLKVTIGEPTTTGTRRLYPIIVEVPANAPAANYPGTNSANYGKVVINTNHEHLRSIPIYLRVVVE